jgi:hypothetical protein
LPRLLKRFGIPLHHIGPGVCGVLTDTGRRSSRAARFLSHSSGCLLASLAHILLVLTRISNVGLLRFFLDEYISNVPTPWLFRHRLILIRAKPEKLPSSFVQYRQAGDKMQDFSRTSKAVSLPRTPLAPHNLLILRKGMHRRMSAAIPTTNRPVSISRFCYH